MYVGLKSLSIKTGVPYWYTCCACVLVAAAIGVATTPTIGRRHLVIFGGRAVRLRSVSRLMSRCVPTEQWSPGGVWVEMRDICPASFVSFCCHPWSGLARLRYYKWFGSNWRFWFGTIHMPGDPECASQDHNRQ